MTAGIETTEWKVPQALRFPIDAEQILRKRQMLKRELLKQSNPLPVRIAILGGSTTAELRSILELFLLAQGIQPEFYESGYNCYCEDVLFENPALWDFKPNIVFIHTTWRNVAEFPEFLEAEPAVEARARREMARFEALWEKIESGLGALIIQNNFDLPCLRPLGNLEASEASSRVNFLLRLNAGFAAHARSHARFLINDILYLSAQAGLEQWFDHSYWHNYHMAVSPLGTVALAQNVAALVKAAYGRSKKCLVLDLDNTLWGGVVGDDGFENLLLGRDHPLGEAFQDFQRYVKDLRRRGVILAVCSKNDAANAKAGFSHPDSILKLEDFSAFKANWEPKPDNIREIALELNIGLDSMVFVDDNPAERALVAAQLPEVAVPDVGSDVTGFAQALDREHYFEAQRVVPEDLQRPAFYNSNAQRNLHRTAFADYGEFLDSLEMSAEIGTFQPVYLERIAQLINKTNQFNLTTRRYTSAEVEALARVPDAIALYGRLADRFGDNGLVSVLVGRVSGDTAEIDTWLMSCRVLKREMEWAMFDALVEQCQARGIRRIVGVYIPSKKNGMVAEHYSGLGFSPAGDADGRFYYEVPRNYVPRTLHIRKGNRSLTVAAQ
jgi:FkbH-like protein